MSLSDTLSALKQIFVLTETQKRLEENLKAVQSTLVTYGYRISQLESEVRFSNQINKNDLENLAKQTELAIENLALKLDSMLKTEALKNATDSFRTKKQKRLPPARKTRKTDSDK